MSETHQDKPTQGRLSLWDAVSIIVGIIIGAGIYETPPGILRMVSGPWIALTIWAVAGLLVFIGALCYAELATTYPRSGGDYVYQTRAYGPLVGFLFGWTQLAVIQTGSIGLMAYVFGDYASRLWSFGDYSSVIYAAAAIVVISAINMLGVVLGKTTQNLLTGAKIVGLALILVAGFGYSKANMFEPTTETWGKVVSVENDRLTIDDSKKSSFEITNDTRIIIDNSETSDEKKKYVLADLPRDKTVKVVSSPSQPEQATWIKVKDAPGYNMIAFALVLVFLTYGGWNDAAFVAAEVRNQKRNIPVTLLLGTALVTLIYLLVNGAYLYGLGFEQAEMSKEIAADTLRLLPGDFGRYGEQIMCVLVMVSALGAVNGLIFTSSRIYSTLGEDYRLFSLLSRWNENAGVPFWSFLASMLISTSMVLMVGTPFGQTKLNALFNWLQMPEVSWTGQGGFYSLLRCTAPVFWAFFLLTGMALLVLRFNDRGIARPFSVPLFPVTPLIFCATCGYMLYSGIGYAGQLGLVGGALVLLGVPLYVFSPRRDTLMHNHPKNEPDYSE